MSGGGKIIEKQNVKSAGRDVVRYRVMDARSWDETFVYAEPAGQEPQLADAIWWGGGQQIHWGEDDSKKLVKVGFSWRAS